MWWERVDFMGDDRCGWRGFMWWARVDVGREG